MNTLSETPMKNLQDLLEQNDYKVRSYSGRGMFGKECLAVSVGNVAQAVQDIATLAAPYLITLPGVNWDSLGRGYIVYWPTLEYDDTTNAAIELGQEYQDA